LDKEITNYNLTKMKTIKDFTPEVQAKIPQYINKALKGVFNGGRYNAFNYESAYKAVSLQYEKSGFKPPLMIVAENPYEAQVLFNYIKNSEFWAKVVCFLSKAEKVDSQLYSQLSSQLYSQLRSQLYSQLSSQLRSQLDSQLDSQLRSQLRSQLYSQLDSQLRSQLRSQLDSQLDSQLRSQLRSQLSSQLRSQLRSQLSSQLDSQLDSQLRSQLRSQLSSQLDSQLDSQLHEYNSSYLFTLNVWSDAYFAWFNFMVKELGVKGEIVKELEIFSTTQENSNIYNAIFSEAVCVVSKYPTKVHRNADLRLHNTKGVAVEWGAYSDLTKFECYYINGRNIPNNIAEIALNNEVTKEIFSNEQNDEHRSAWYSYLGEERMLEVLGAVEVDRFNVTHNNNEQETITLFRTKENLNKFKGKPYAWLKRICPSTGNVYLTPTNPDFKTAEESAKFHRPDWIPSSLGYHWYSRS
jgi:hypothetical protein